MASVQLREPGRLTGLHASQIGEVVVVTAHRRRGDGEDNPKQVEILTGILESFTTTTEGDGSVVIRVNGAYGRAFRRSEWNIHVELANSHAYHPAEVV